MRKRVNVGFFVVYDACSHAKLTEFHVFFAAKRKSFLAASHDSRTVPPLGGIRFDDKISSRIRSFRRSGKS